VLPNPYRPESHSSWFQYLLDAALSRPVPAGDSRDPGGADNSYGHPTPETPERLRRAGARVFRNDEDGDVIVTIKDEELEVAVTRP
jgi:hypothetical protein